MLMGAPPGGTTALEFCDTIVGPKLSNGPCESPEAAARRALIVVEITQAELVAIRDHQVERAVTVEIGEVDTARSGRPAS